ncbi:hypothetical protein RHMOL_Rhmol03G0151000 [Rhododendron molle]|uniref:Uncharacterized protein n=2 Tax=Rhododendron molle TaxID=49168 RepID=A0ACC0PG17_RHOML|nr:hypothetical protein RHMOL_Rhmol03G0151000 [Rhododendron molle]KAI8564010.1 hypothetical protein RHMOL_Rhmol03G0151000 [Rhododendron molle]
MDRFWVFKGFIREHQSEKNQSHIQKYCTGRSKQSIWKVLTRMFLETKLSNMQWLAIVLLAVGTTRSQVKGCGGASCDFVFSSPIQGYMLGILSACLSALAGVYTKFLMKKNNDSLYWQNVQLYTFGSIFNMGHLQFDDFRGGFEKGPWCERLFNGYSIITWMVVLNLGSTGLLVSWLMKYADNVVKVYSTSMAMLLTMVVLELRLGEVSVVKWIASTDLIWSHAQSKKKVLYLGRLILLGKLTYWFLQVYLANLRLKEVGTVVLITAYEPILINPLSESASSVGAGLAAPAAESERMLMAEVFKLAVSSF